MLKIYQKNADINRKLLYLTLINFLIILCWIVIFKVNRSWVPEVKDRLRSLPIIQRFGKNIIPGRSIVKELNAKGFSFSSDHFLNVLAFMPFGILLPYFIEKKGYTYTALISFGSSLFFELLQLFTGIGHYDSSDLITNTLGGVVGILLYRFAFSKIRGNIINIISTSVSVIATPFSAYAIFNTIRHFDYYL